MIDIINEFREDIETKTEDVLSMCDSREEAEEGLLKLKQTMANNSDNKLAMILLPIAICSLEEGVSHKWGGN